MIPWGRSQTPFSAGSGSSSDGLAAICRQGSVLMTRWIRWTPPIALIVSIGSAANAVQYMSLSEAQRHAFPSATTFSVIQSDRIWRAEAGGRVLGFFIFDRVIGKHLYIDYSVALDPSGRIRQVDILEYRESYGGEIRSPSWLAQFVGKTNGSALQVGVDIRNISGATLSCHHVTEGVKRIMAIANRLR
jgi:Na+-transporting NADH:ubiquinone oxidoreductase subunit C